MVGKSNSSNCSQTDEGIAPQPDSKQTRGTRLEVKEGDTLIIAGSKTVEQQAGKITKIQAKLDEEMNRT